MELSDKCYVYALLITKAMPPFFTNPSNALCSATKKNFEAALINLLIR